MYEYMPPKQNGKAQKMIGLLFAGSVLLLFLPALLNAPFQSFFQLLGVACLVGAIFLVTRYITKDFLYRVFPDDDGTLDFSVTEIQNKKKQVTVCRISLSDIEEIVTVKNSDSQAVKAIRNRIQKEGRRSFYYSPELAPAEYCYLFVSEPTGGLMVIAINPDETLLRILENR